MKNLVKFIGSLLLVALFTNLSISQCESSKKHAKQVSHHPDIVDIAIGSDVHTTLVAAVKAADLVSTLKSDGPFTVFAPTNSAFEKLPAGTIESLLDPGNKSTLTNILTYHVVPSRLDAKTIINSINASGGEFTMTTVSGGELTASLRNGNVILQDENDNWSFVTAADLEGSNGIIHVVDSVVLPN